MAHIVCPSCRRKIPLVPGKSIVCPACNAPVAVKYRAPIAANRGEPEAQANRKSVVWAFLAGGGALVVLFIGAFVLIRSTGQKKSAPDLPNPTPAVAARPPIAPSATPRPPEPAPKHDPNDKRDPAERFFGVPAPRKTAPPAAVPKEPVVVDPPEQVLVTKTIVREVPGVTPATVQAAITKGVQFLGASRNTWFNDKAHPLGYVALGGLTLLECKAQQGEPTIQLAADATRRMALNSDQTYEIALAILFLDRLGDVRDRPLIQALAARLIAGQASGGGYSYKCPILSPMETSQLLAFLERTRPRGSPAPSQSDEASYDKPLINPLDPFAKMEPGKDRPPEVAAPEAAMPEAGIGKEGDLVSQPPKIRPKSRLSTTATVRLEKPAINPAMMLPARLQQIPAVINQGREKENLILTFPEAIPTDQSNLQFAILGMWAARRHGVASDRALLVADARLRKLQAPDGRWEYDNRKNYHEPMICAGMLGLVIGNAVHYPHPGHLAQAIEGDRQIALAIQALGKIVSDPKSTADAPPVSVFLLWSVERVAVLFNFTTIDGKDWYGWGAQSLIKNQQPDGSWNNGLYPGTSLHTDTCFSLLFLVRSNLVREISEYIQVPPPAPKRK